MNYVYISPHFPPFYVPFATALRDQGVNVLGLADAPHDQLPGTLKSALGEYYQVANLEDYDQKYRALGHFCHRHGRLDRLESHNEHWLESDARLRTDFNIPGFRSEDIARIKRKSEMKNVFRQAGVDCARGILVTDERSARDFAGEVGFPLVVKPDTGVGAARTYKLNKPADLEAFLAERPPMDYYMEEFIEGVIQSFDGLTDQDGNPVFFTAHVFSSGIMEVVNQVLDIHYYSMRTIPQDLEAAGRKLLNAFGVRERFFHFEFFRTPAGRLVALEVNMRPPGGLTVMMFNYANDLDIFRQYARVVASNRFDAEVKRPYHCCYIGRQYADGYHLSHEDVLSRYRDILCHQEPISGVFAAAIGRHGYLVRSPDLAQVESAAKEITARI